MGVVQFARLNGRVKDTEAHDSRPLRGRNARSPVRAGLSVFAKAHLKLDFVAIGPWLPDRASSVVAVVGLLRSKADSERVFVPLVAPIFLRY
jgi:hypothetical protein